MMKKNFKTSDWKEYLPEIVCDEFPEYIEFYNKTWELARDHVKEIDGMPQSPYMDEAFCDTQVWIWDSCFMAMFCKLYSLVWKRLKTSTSPCMELRCCLKFFQAKMSLGGRARNRTSHSVSKFTLRIIRRCLLGRNTKTLYSTGIKSI